MNVNWQQKCRVRWSTKIKTIALSFTSVSISSWMEFYAVLHAKACVKAGKKFFHSLHVAVGSVVVFFLNWDWRRVFALYIDGISFSNENTRVWKSFKVISLRTFCFVSNLNEMTIIANDFNLFLNVYLNRAIELLIVTEGFIQIPKKVPEKRDSGSQLHFRYPKL